MNSPSSALKDYGDRTLMILPLCGNLLVRGILGVRLLLQRPAELLRRVGR